MRDEGKRWGFMRGLMFIPLPKQPMIDAGHTQPPFVVVLPTGETRNIIEEPDQE